MILREGEQAPPFDLETTDGSRVALKDLAGKTVVLYFYPKDDTPGCTKEACHFRDDYAEYRDRDVVVLGISPDDRQSHVKFSEKFNLPFPLLVDLDHKLADRYGVWVEKDSFGKKTWGIKRATFIIGPDGTIRKTFDTVDVDRHSAEVLALL